MPPPLGASGRAASLYPRGAGPHPCSALGWGARSSQAGGWGQLSTPVLGPLHKADAGIGRCLVGSVWQQWVGSPDRPRPLRVRCLPTVQGDPEAVLLVDSAAFPGAQALPAGAPVRERGGQGLCPPLLVALSIQVACSQVAESLGRALFAEGPAPAVTGHGAQGVCGLRVPHSRAPSPLYQGWAPPGQGLGRVRVVTTELPAAGGSRQKTGPVLHTSKSGCPCGQGTSHARTQGVSPSRL